MNQQFITRNDGLITNGGDLAIIFQEPLRFLAPISRVVKQCRKDLVDWTGVDGRSDEWIRQRWELMRPRVHEVLDAARMLDGIAFGDKAVEPETIIRIFATLQNTIGTARKSDEANAVAQVCAVNMFDADIDASGGDLAIWSEVPRDPHIVALASQSLLVNSTFTPSHAELASACRLARRKIEDALKVLLEWSDAFDRCDVGLLSQSHQSYEVWAPAWGESVNLVEDLYGFVSGFEFERPEWPHQVQRRGDKRRFFRRNHFLRQKFIEAMKTKSGPLSDVELKEVFSSCSFSDDDFLSWFDHEEYVKEVARREEERQRLEEEEKRREKERQRLIEKRRHMCSFCGTAENKVADLIDADQIPACMLVRRREPATICSECIEEGIGDTKTAPQCWFCGETDKCGVVSMMDNRTTICEDCFKLCEHELQLRSHPIIEFIIGEKRRLTDEFAKDYARKFNAFVEAQGTKKVAIYLRLNGYDDDYYGQPPWYCDEAPEVTAYIRSWARFAKLDVKRAVQLFGPDSWGGNRLPETLHFLFMCDVFGEFSSQCDEATPDECIELLVKLCAEKDAPADAAASQRLER